MDTCRKEWLDALLSIVDPVLSALRTMKSWYVGDGAYGDGEFFHWDYHNSFVIQPMYVDLVELFAPEHPEIAAMRPAAKARAARYAAVLERMIGPDGSYPILGRSICYRFGAFQMLSQAALQHCLGEGLSPAAVRCGLTAVIRRVMDTAPMFDEQGWLLPGVIGQQPELAEGYISVGSLYLCSAVFLPLGLPEQDPLASDLFPSFEEQTLEERPDGSRVIRDGNGLIVLVKPGIVSIPAEIGTSLTDRDVWENEYLPRLRFSMERIPTEILATLRDDTNREIPVGLHCGSLMGRVRDLLGVEQMSYLTVDDPDLLEEIIDTMDSLCYDCVKAMLDSGAKFDYAHFWEDICFKKAAFWQLYRKWEASGMAPEASHSLVFRFRFVCADADRQDFAASIRSKSSAHASVSAHGTTALSVFPSRMQRMDSSIS